MPHRAMAAGFSLVEVLVALALAAILLGVAMPNLQPLIARWQLRTATADLQNAIDLTRSQAIGRGRIVLLAPLDPAGVAWEQGWSIFADSNGNRRHDPGEPLFGHHGPVAGGIAISANLTSAAPPLVLAYNGAGRSCSPDNGLAAQWGTLTLKQGQDLRRIKINMLGRLRVCDPALEPADCEGVDAP